jgi:hypothetical protein
MAGDGPENGICNRGSNGNIHWTFDGLQALAVGVDRRRLNQVILAVVVMAVVVVTVFLGGALPKGGAASGTTLAKKESTTAASPTVDQFLSNLPRYSLELAESNASSPQALALEWLRIDPLYNDYELRRLYQRYALAVLYFSTQGGSLSYDNECTWNRWLSADVCDKSFRLTRLILWEGIGLVGTLPVELELLTDLETMKLGGTEVELPEAIYSNL